MTKMPGRMSAARRNAEALLGQAQKGEKSLRADQERERDAMTAKIARLRALRLAKEAADVAAGESQSSARTKSRRVSDK